MSGVMRLAGALAAVSLLAGTMQPPSAGTPTTSHLSVPARVPANPALLQVRLPGDDAPAEDGPTTGPRDEPAPDCAKLKCVALTMDDGPVAHTAKVLALLRAEQVHATFFVMGVNARQHPALIRRMLAEGNAVGNHSWDHPQFQHLSAKGIRRELARTDSLLKRITGQRPSLVRPPFGQVNAKVRRVAKARGQALVLWDVDPQDWKDHKAKLVAKRVVTHARRGSIILTHDVWPSTRHAYARIIKGLKARGFTLVTVPQLLAAKAEPGRVYLRCR